jgi:hypothetical protein
VVAVSAHLPFVSSKLLWSELFDRVQAHYGCSAEERELMRRATLNDPEGARRCYEALLVEIEAGPKP